LIAKHFTVNAVCVNGRYLGHNVTTLTFIQNETEGPKQTQKWTAKH